MRAPCCEWGCYARAGTPARGKEFPESQRWRGSCEPTGLRCWVVSACAFLGRELPMPPSSSQGAVTLKVPDRWPVQGRSSIGVWRRSLQHGEGGTLLFHQFMTASGISVIAHFREWCLTVFTQNHSFFDKGGWRVPRKPGHGPGTSAFDFGRGGSIFLNEGQLWAWARVQASPPGFSLLPTEPKSL